MVHFFDVCANTVAAAKKEKKKRKRKKGTMNDVKLLHIKVLFSPIFSPVALKNKKKFCPQEKV